MFESSGLGGAMTRGQQCSVLSANTDSGPTRNQVSLALLPANGQDWGRGSKFSSNFQILNEHLRIHIITCYYILHTLYFFYLLNTARYINPAQGRYPGILLTFVKLYYDFQKVA